MVKRSSHCEVVKHHAIDGRKIVDNLEGLHLIGRVFGRSEVGDEAVFADYIRGCFIEVQIERNAT